VEDERRTVDGEARFENRGFEIRRNDEKEIDEIFVRDANHVHVEQLSDTCWWIYVARKDGSAFMIHLWTQVNAPILCSIEDE